MIADNIRAADFTRIFKTTHKAARRRKIIIYERGLDRAGACGHILGKLSFWMQISILDI